MCESLIIEMTLFFKVNRQFKYRDV